MAFKIPETHLAHPQGRNTMLTILFSPEGEVSDPVILAGSWEGIRMMPEDLSLFLSLSSWVMIGTERT